jgi:dTDP-4-amino-4,6-dideoxygalactose transaminase
LIPHSRPWVMPEDTHAVQEALEERAVCTWHHAGDLARVLAGSSGAGSCRLYATGTLALRAALRDLHLPPGSGVGIPAFTCPDVLRGVVSAGYNPVVLDCDAQGLLSVADTTHAFEQGRIQAAVCVHQFGLLHRGMADVAAAMPVIEDCSHVPPGFYLEASAAAIGSLEGTKLLGAGEGGYHLGRKAQPDDPAEVGDRLSDVLAVLALCQMERLVANLEKRAGIAARYQACCPPGSIVDGERGAWFRFLLRRGSRQAVDALITAGAAAGITLKRPIMPHPLNHRTDVDADACPTADRLWETLVSIPFYPDLQEEEITVIERFLEQSFGMTGQEKAANG